MKKFWQKYTTAAAKQVENKWYKPLWITIIVSYILFVVLTCIKGKFADSLADFFNDYAILMFAYAFTQYLCSKKIVIWLSILLTMVLVIAICGISFGWFFIAQLLFMRP